MSARATRRYSRSRSRSPRYTRRYSRSRSRSGSPYQSRGGRSGYGGGAGPSRSRRSEHRYVLLHNILFFIKLFASFTWVYWVIRLSLYKTFFGFAMEAILKEYKAEMVEILRYLLTWILKRIKTWVIFGFPTNYLIFRTKSYVIYLIYSSSFKIFLNDA